MPASLVAWRWSSLKYAGTVMTALSTVSPRYASASAFSFCRIIALISGGAYSLSPSPAFTFTRASPLGPETTSKGTIFSSSLTSASLRPMKRLIEKTVFSGFVTACRLAGRAYEALATLRERDDRGGGARALGVLDHGGLAALEDGHARVGRAQIDTDRLAHPKLLLYRLQFNLKEI